MAADSTVNIDVVLGGKDKFISDTKEINDIAKNIGKDSGNELEKDLSDNLDKSKTKAKQTHDDIEKEFKDPIKSKFDADDKPLRRKTEEVENALRKVPKEVITKITADAKEQGIDNFDKLLKKLPKQVRTELLTKAQKGEVINYEELLKKVPLKILTKAELNDNASPKLKELQNNTENTEHKFKQLKETMLGVFAGNVLTAGVGMVVGKLKDLTGEAIKASDAMDKFRSTMKLGGFGSEEINKTAKEVQKYANDTVYELNDVANTTAQLAANGIKDYMGLTEAAGNLNAQAGGTKETFKSVAMVMTQTAGAGKLTTDNWNQLTNAIPGASGKLQEAMKKNGAYTGNFRDAMEKGQISAKEFNKAISQLGMTKAAKEAAASTATFEGAIGNLEAAVVTSISNIITELGKANFTGIINTTTKWVENLGTTVGKFLHDNKDEIAELLKNLGNIATIIGSAVWDTFKGILNMIADALGVTHDKGDSASDVLDEINDILETIIDNKEDLKAFIKVMLGLFVAKKAWDMVTALTSYYKILKDIIGLGGLSGIAKGIGVGAKGGKLATTAEEVAAGGVKATGASKVGRLIGIGADKLFGIQRGGQEVAEAVAKSTVEKVGQRTAVRAAEKGIIARTASRIPVVGSLIAGGTELIGINKNNKNEKIGRAVGATGGTAAGGAAGAWIGGAIGSIVPGAGTAVGAGVGSLIGSTVGGMLGAKGGGSIGKNFTKIKKDTGKVFDELKTSVTKKVADIGKGIASGFGKAISGISKVFNKIKKPVVKVFDALGKEIKREAKIIGTIALAPFVLLTAAIIKVWQKIEKPVMKVINSLKKNIEKAWNPIAKTTSKVWNGIAKTVSKTWNSLSKVVSKGIKSITKVVSKTWNGLEKITSKAWNSVKNTIVNIVGAIWKPLSKTFSKIVDAVSDAWNDVLKATKRIWNRILDKISDVLGGIWKAIKRKFDDIKDTISGVLDAIKSKWNSIWDGIKQKVSDIWGSIKGIVHDGVKAIGNFWNTGANGLEKVAGFFGAKISVPKFKQGSSGPVARPMLAMVNDQEGPLHREAIFRQNGKVEIPEGRNVLTMLHPGDAVMPAKETAEMFGIPRFEGGFGNWFGKAWNYASSKISKLEDMIDDKIDAITDALSDPLGTLLKIYSAGTNTAKSFWHDFGDSGAKKIPHWGETWFKNLLTKLKDKLDEIGGNGPVSESLIKRAASKMHVNVSAGDIAHILNVIQHESGGNARAINLWDSNAKAGHPSKGILQFIDSTFMHYAMPGHHDIYKPFDQLLAMFNDMTWRSDLTLGGWGPSGGRRYANGGWADRPSIFGEVDGEPEIAINPARSTADNHIIEAIKARAAKNPNGMSAKLNRIIQAGRYDGSMIAPSTNISNVSKDNTNVKYKDYSGKLDRINKKLEDILNKRLVVDGSSFAPIYEDYGTTSRTKRQNLNKRGVAVNANL
ncbi:tape measure protein [Ligilactobacillus salivarius]|uniref:tape measure protein n=1 Tax=Ligilactobacillus salivarius TaxID=1624 RepID=UPI001CC18768|nr:tape measure protein [Ligilactobacillus salivarius]MBZ4030208.1 tape measure protein [Ligilactobacillus salivarius]